MSSARWDCGTMTPLMDTSCRLPTETLREENLKTSTVDTKHVRMCSCSCFTVSALSCCASTPNRRCATRRTWLTFTVTYTISSTASRSLTRCSMVTSNESATNLAAKVRLPTWWISWKACTEPSPLTRIPVRVYTKAPLTRTRGGGTGGCPKRMCTSPVSWVKCISAPRMPSPSSSPPPACMSNLTVSSAVRSSSVVLFGQLASKAASSAAGSWSSSVRADPLRNTSKGGH
mmetsp:Transcript_4484/g.8347  ORF Transcript_4484/g.8347 Transcript_4484/m.8347 type:complete len:231 (+) Transcript_4484:975-1667(+)